MVQFTIRTMQQDLRAALTKPSETGGKLPSPLPVMTPPPQKLPTVSKPAWPAGRPTEISKPPLKPIARPAPVKPALKEQESKILLEEGWQLYKNKSYLNALEKFEKAAILPTAWWTKFKIKNAIKTCRKQIAHLEKIRQEEQKKLETHLKADLEEKIKKEEEAKLKTQEEERIRLEEKARREAEEKVRLEAISKPVEIPKPVEAPKPAKPIEIPRPAWPAKISYLKIAIPALIVLLLLGTGIYWLSYKKIQPAKPETPGVQKTEIVLPAAYFNVESTEIISLKNGQESELAGLLEKITEQNQNPGAFKRIIVKKTNGEEKILTLSELFKILKIKPPGNFSENAADDYMLFLYGQKKISPDPFYAGLGKTRLGIIIKVTDSGKMKEAMITWENNNLSYILSPLFFNKAPLPGQNEKLQEDNYRNFLIRYLHAPDKYSSINYTLIKDNLLITTSQESVYSAIDRLLK